MLALHSLTINASAAFSISCLCIVGMVTSSGLHTLTQNRTQKEWKYFWVRPFPHYFKSNCYYVFAHLKMWFCFFSFSQSELPTRDIPVDWFQRVPRLPDGSRKRQPAGKRDTPKPRSTISDECNAFQTALPSLVPNRLPLNLTFRRGRFEDCYEALRSQAK